MRRSGLSSPKSYPSKATRETPRCRARDYITRKLFRVDRVARDRRPAPSPLLQPIQSKHHKPKTAPKLPPRSAQTRTHHKPAHKAASRKRSDSYAQDDPKDLRPTTSSTPRSEERRVGKEC